MTPSQNAPMAMKAHMRNHCSCVYPKSSISFSVPAVLTFTIGEKNNSLLMPKIVVQYIKIDRQSGQSQILLSKTKSFELRLLNPRAEAKRKPVGCNLNETDFVLPKKQSLQLSIDCDNIMTMIIK